MVNARLVAIMGYAADAEMVDTIILNAPSLDAIEDRVNDEEGIVLYLREASQEEIEEAEREA